MMLSRLDILKAIKKKGIGITPFDKSCVGAVSYDLHLGSEFMLFRKHGRAIFVKEDTILPKNHARKVVLGPHEVLHLKPQQFVLGVTKEKIKLSGKYAGRIEGRSRFARLGLMVHISSSLIQPGSNNVQVLEIVNLSTVPLILKPGTRICQVTFFETSGDEKYAGKFRLQSGIRV
ncbi:MAG: dCTP deaminase [Candidatus Micrarchaeota archaeon]